MRTWHDYRATSARDFLKHYTDGDVGVGGTRYECAKCGAEYSDVFGVRGCFYFCHNARSEFNARKHALPIEFDKNGFQTI